jgi:hypothetical protein
MTTIPSEVLAVLAVHWYEKASAFRVIGDVSSSSCFECCADELHDLIVKFKIKEDEA